MIMIMIVIIVIVVVLFLCMKPQMIRSLFLSNSIRIFLMGNLFIIIVSTVVGVVVVIRRVGGGLPECSLFVKNAASF